MALSFAISGGHRALAIPEILAALCAIATEKHYDSFSDLGTVLSLFAQNEPQLLFHLTVR
jgi:hypothetical protein